MPGQLLLLQLRPILYGSMADETFKNPHTAGVQCDSESEEESDDDLEDEDDRNGIDED